MEAPTRSPAADTSRASTAAYLHKQKEYKVKASIQIKQIRRQCTSSIYKDTKFPPHYPTFSIFCVSTTFIGPRRFSRGLRGKYNFVL